MKICHYDLPEGSKFLFVLGCCFFGSNLVLINGLSGVKLETKELFQYCYLVLSGNLKILDLPNCGQYPGIPKVFSHLEIRVDLK